MSYVDGDDENSFRWSRYEQMIYSFFFIFVQFLKRTALILPPRLELPLVLNAQKKKVRILVRRRAIARLIGR
jgi:hypothetical protein